MRIKIHPDKNLGEGYSITVNNDDRPLAVNFPTYDGACAVANAIAKHGRNWDENGAVVIDYLDVLTVELR
jgi:hypothetical protein